MGKTNIEIEKIVRSDKSQELEFRGEDNFEYYDKYFERKFLNDTSE